MGAGRRAGDLAAVVGDVLETLGWWVTGTVLEGW